jgi:exonuclease SbcD
VHDLQTTVWRRRARVSRHRFLHASDLALDAPVRGIASLPATLEPALRDAALGAWAALVDAAIAERVAFVLLAGHLIGADPPSVRSCTALHDGMRRLRSHGIATVAALGADEERSAVLRWLGAAATVLTSVAPRTVVTRNGRSLASIDRTPARGAQGSDAITTRAPGIVNIEVVPDAGAPGRATAAAQHSLADARGTYAALGGYAAHAICGSDPWLVYAGTPQGRGLEALECGEKGAVLVEVANGHIVGVERRPLDRVRFVSLDLDVGARRDPTDCAAQVFRMVAPAIRAAGPRPVIAEAVLSGAPAGERTARSLFAAELLALLRRASADTPLWWAQIRDRTAPAPDTGGRLAQIVIDRSLALGAPLPRSQFLAETFAPLLSRYAVETELPAQRELVHDAAALALKRLDRAARDAGG